MKKYLKPEIDVLKFSYTDVMAQSGASSGSGKTPSFPLSSPGGSMWYPQFP